MDPPDFHWELTPTPDAGTLTNKTNQHPVYTSPSSISDGGTFNNGTLTMRPDMDEHKVIRIYKDHLARDKENFGSIWSKEKGDWDAYFGKIYMDHRWNCHCSVLHAFDGSGGGLKDFEELPCLGWGQPTILPYPLNVDASTILNRGDVIAIHTTDSGFQSKWLHSATCTGGTLTWGANNSKFNLGGFETWQFATRDVNEVFRDYHDHMTTNVTLYIFKKQ